MRMYRRALDIWSRKDWHLFQHLLHALRKIADKHSDILNREISATDGPAEVARLVQTKLKSGLVQFSMNEYIVSFSVGNYVG